MRYACQGASCWLGPVHCLGARWGGVAIPDQPGWNSGMPPPHTKPTRSPAALRHNPRACGNSRQVTSLSQSKKSSTTTTSILSTLIMISLSLHVANPSSQTYSIPHIKGKKCPVTFVRVVVKLLARLGNPGLSLITWSPLCLICVCLDFFISLIWRFIAQRTNLQNTPMQAQAGSKEQAVKWHHNRHF